MRLRLSLPSITALAVIFLATVLMVPVLAGSVPPATGTGNDEVPQFTYENGANCDGDLSYEVFRVDDSTTTVTTTIEVTEDPGDTLTQVTFSVPELDGDQWVFERYCDDSLQEQRSFDFSRVLLTKAVEGDVPEDATFIVSVSCDVNGDPIITDVEREFTADGGNAQVVLYQSGEGIECTISEPEDGGADSVTIDPETLDYPEFSDGSSTVTNTFPAPEPSPDPSPSPEPSPSPSPETDDTVEEADPAEPIETEPDFTG